MGRDQVAMLQMDEAMGSLTAAFDYFINAGKIRRALVVPEYPLPAYAGRFRWPANLAHKR